MERWSTGVLGKQFLEQLTNIEQGFLYTAKYLFVSPGKIVEDYWKGITVKTYNPFRYVIIWTAVNLIVNFWLGIDDLLQEHLQPDMVENSFSKTDITLADQKFDAWLNALVLLLLPVFSLLTKWLFPKKQKNYAEHLILNSFLMGQQALITSFTHFIFYIFHGLFSIFLGFNFAVGLVYNFYVFKQVFSEKLLPTIIKALIIGIFGMIVFFSFVAGASAIALYFTKS